MADLTRDNRWIMLALFLWASGEGLFTYIQPIYIQQLGADPVQIGSVLSLAGLALALAYLPGGLLADRLPRKTLLMGGWGLGIMGALLMAAARDWREFIPAIMLYSFSAFCVPAISATIAYFAAQEAPRTGGAPLARVLTLTYAGYSAGSVLSPSVGGWLSGVIGMRAIYLMAAVCFVASTSAMLQVAAQPVAARPAAAASRLPVLRSGALLALIVFAIFMTMTIGQPLAPNFLRNAAGWPVERIGLLGSLNALGVTALSPALGRWSSSRRGGALSGLWAAQALVWGSLVLLFAGAQRGWPWVVFLAFFMRGGYSACRSLMGAHVAGSVSAEDRGVAFGLMESAAALALMGAPYLAGWLYTVHPAAPIGAGLVLVPLGMALTPLTRDGWSGRRAA